MSEADAAGHTFSGSPPAGRAGLDLEVVRGCRVLSGEGLVEAFGHVSARMSGTRFLITPRKGLAEVTAEELLEVEIEPGGSAPPRVVEGDPASLPVEAVIHAAVYEARADVGAIARDHGEASTVLGCAGVAIRTLHVLGAVGPPVVPVSDVSELVADWPAGRALAESLGQASAVLLRGNGRVIVGESVGEACARAVLVEESARLQLSALAAGLRPRFLSESEIAAAVRDIASSRQVRRVWEHYCAKHPADSGGGEMLE